jgi:hypothetical protein
MEKKNEPIWIVDPSGHIVKQPPSESKKPLQPGWRMATDSDLRYATAAAAKADEVSDAKARAEIASAYSAQAESEAAAAASADGGPLKPAE